MNSDSHERDPELTEAELAAALEHTYGMSPGHAAETAAAHHGRPPRCLVGDPDRKSIAHFTRRET